MQASQTAPSGFLQRNSGLSVPNSPCGLCERKATLNSNTQHVSEPISCVEVEVAVWAPRP